MNTQLHRSEKGFTIIELMIATAVLSTILVMVTVLMVNIGNLYYKGLNQSRVQDDTRSISSDVVSNIQLSSTAPFNKPVTPTTAVYCIGPVRYFYVLGVQIGKPAPNTTSPVYNQVLWRDNNPIPNQCPIQIDPNATSGPAAGPVDLTSTQSLSLDASKNQGREMLTSNSRLTQFTINTDSTTSLSTVTVGVAYGDNDLLSGYTGDVHCKGGLGNQFCSTASLTVQTSQRLTSNSF